MTRHTRNRSAVLGVLLVLQAAVPVSAQERSAAGLTLEAAFDRALAANPTATAARLRRAVSVAGLGVAAERLNPEATFEIEKETPKQALGVALPIEMGGKRAKRVAVSQAGILSSDAELAVTLTQIRNDVRRAYFETLATESRLTVFREQGDLFERARNAAQVRFDNGDAPRLEVMQADLALASAQSEAAATEGLAIAARTRLNALLGQPLGMTEALSTPLDARAPVDSPSVVDAARRSSVELALLDRRLDEQRAKLTLAQALRVPDLTPTATLTHAAQPDFTYGWRAGIAVTLPVFARHQAGVAVEQATLDQLAAERLAALQRLTSEVTAAAAAAEALRIAYERYRDAILPQAQQVEQLAQDSYRLGQTGIAALLQALQATREVRLRSIDAVSQFQNAVADLERAIGAPLP